MKPSKKQLYKKLNDYVNAMVEYQKADTHYDVLYEDVEDARIALKRLINEVYDKKDHLPKTTKKA